MTQRIGILGGTFNPIHIAHLVMAQEVLEQLKLDKVLFVPSNLPPHKSSKNVAKIKHRYQMVSLAIIDNPHFEILDYELKHAGKSYSIDTVNFLCEDYPRKTQFFFIIGEDSLATLPTWKLIDDLLTKVTFVVVNRPGSKIINSKIKTHFITMPALEISSSEIRDRLSKGEAVKYLLPEKVLTYIQSHKLYNVKGLAS